MEGPLIPGVPADLVAALPPGSLCPPYWAALRPRCYSSANIPHRFSPQWPPSNFPAFKKIYIYFWTPTANLLSKFPAGSHVNPPSNVPAFSCKTQQPVRLVSNTSCWLSHQSPPAYYYSLSYLTLKDQSSCLWKGCLFMTDGKASQSILSIIPSPAPTSLKFDSIH